MKSKTVKTTMKMNGQEKKEDRRGFQTDKNKICKRKRKKLPFNTFLVSFKTETETVQGETKRGEKGKACVYV